MSKPSKPAMRAGKKVRRMAASEVYYSIEDYTRVIDEETGVDELVEALEKAAHELNVIRARDGAPQHINWYRGHPTQTEGCSQDYWHELTELCYNAIRKAKGTL